MAKKTKGEARYSEAKPDGDKCRDCRWFDRPHSCELVGGFISPTGWCKFWHARAGHNRAAVLANRQDEDRRMLAKLKETREAGA